MIRNTTQSDKQLTKNFLFMMDGSPKESNERKEIPRNPTFVAGIPNKGRNILEQSATLSLSKLLEKQDEDEDDDIFDNIDNQPKQLSFHRGQTTHFIFDQSKEKCSQTIQSTKEFEFLYTQYLSNCALQCLFSLISIASAIIEYEHTVVAIEPYSLTYIHTHVYSEDMVAQYGFTQDFFRQAGQGAFAASIITFLATILLWISIIFDIILQNRMNTFPKEFSVFEILTHQDSILNLCISLVFFLLSPNPFCFGHEVSMDNERYATSFNIPLNSLFTLLCVCRLWFLIKYYLVQSTYYNPRAHRVAKMNSLNLSLGFSFKAYMKNNPLLFDLFLFIIALFICSYDLRIVERYLDDNGDFEFGNFLNSLWTIFITMTTVGYGDFSASTVLGRLVSIIGCFFGVFLLSLIVIAVTAFLNLEGTEEKVYMILERTMIMQEKDKKAENFIRDLILAYHKNLLQHDPKKKEKKRLEIQHKLKVFQLTSSQLDSCFPGFSSYDNIEEHLNFLEEHLNETNDQYIELVNWTDELKHLAKKKMGIKISSEASSSSSLINGSAKSLNKTKSIINKSKDRKINHSQKSSKNLSSNNNSRLS